VHVDEAAVGRGIEFGNSIVVRKVIRSKDLGFRRRIGKRKAADVEAKPRRMLLHVSK